MSLTVGSRIGRHEVTGLLGQRAMGEVYRIAIGDKAPEKCFLELVQQCDGGKRRYGGIVSLPELRRNLTMSCIPESLLDGVPPIATAF